MSVLALVFSEQLVFDGIVRGMIYGLLGIGIVLVFRASGVINFAQGQFGTIGASVMAVLYVNEGTPFWVTVPLAILIGAVVGGLTELLVVRRLFNQPRLLLFIATVGVAQVILLLQLQLPQIDLPVTYPTPINDRWHIGDLVVRGDQLIVLVAVPLIVRRARVPASTHPLRTLRAIRHRQPERGFALRDAGEVGVHAGLGARRSARRP